MGLGLDRLVDLHQPGDIEYLLEVIASRPHTTALSLSQVRDGLKALVHFFPNADWLKVYEPGWVVVFRRYSYLLDDMILLGLWVTRIAICKGFEEFMIGFQNPNQFSDSLFEAEIANTLLDLPTCQVVNLSPMKTVGSHLKRPDFECITARGQLVCECKSSRTLANKYSTRIQTIAQEFKNTAIQAGGIASDLRLEVDIAAPVSGRMEDAVKKAVNEVFHAGVEGLPLYVGPFKLALLSRSTPPMFAKSSPTLSFMDVDQRPRRIGPENAWLRVTCSCLFGQQQKAAGKLMRETLSQLPEKEHCMIFVKVSNGDAGVMAAQRRLEGTGYEHVVGIGVWSPNGNKVVHRETDKSLLERLLK